MNIDEIISLGTQMMAKYQHCYRVSKDSKTVYFTLKCKNGGIPDIPVSVDVDRHKAEKYLRKAIGKALDKANHYAKGIKTISDL